MTRTDATEPGTIATVIHLDFDRQSEIAPAVRECSHRQFVVDGASRTVTCAACKEPLDPFQILLEYAREERSWRYYEAECERAMKRLVQLKAEERRVKERTKRASRKEAETAVAEERLRTETARIDITETARDIAQLSRRIEQLAQRRTS